MADNGRSTSQVVAVVTLFPVGGILLSLAGLILTGTLLGLAVSAPLFLLFSPIIVPALFTIALAVAGFFASGVFAIMALSSLTWIIDYFRKMSTTIFDQVRRRVGDTAGHVGQNLREAAQDTLWS